MSKKDVEHLFSAKFGCGVCHDLWPLTKSITINSKRFYCRFWKLRVSAALQGCPSCQLLVRATRNFEAVCNFSVANVQLHFAYPDEPTDWIREGHSYAFLQFQLKNGAWSDYYQLICFSGNVSPWKGIPTRSHISYHTGSISTVDWAIDHLKSCTESHNNCRRKELNPLPTRILKINYSEGDVASDQPFDVKLHIYKNNESGRYACLSHCWGDVQFIRTKKENIEEHERGIDWNSLPRTFQHAIRFTYRLGIRFLWIDSLCIIQDDERDWRREAGKMFSIFENSFITLSASAGANGLHGLLPERRGSPHIETSDLISISPPDVNPQLKPDSPSYSSERTPNWHSHCGFRNADWRCNMVYMRRTHEHWRFLWWPYSTFGLFDQFTSTDLSRVQRSWTYREKMLGTKSNLFPLFQRGWCYQERLISPRILHFGPRELLWECSQMSDCQCGGLESIFSSRSEMDSQPKVSHYRTLTQSEEGVHRASVASHRWNHVVREYSVLNLTFPSDKLPAIAGIARQLQPSIGCPYLAGIWGDDRIHEGLLWEIVAMKRPKPEIWRAPSWSWASVEGMVSFPNDFVDSDYTILKVVCTPLGPDPFGAVSDGYLRVKGKLLRVGWSQVSHKSKPRDSKEDQSMFVLVRRGLEETLNVSFDYNWPPKGKTHSCGRMNGEKQQHDLICFMLGCRKRGTGRDSPPPMGLVYLVLQYVDEVKQIYERVGVGHDHGCYELFSGIEECVITIK